MESDDKAFQACSCLTHLTAQDWRRWRIVTLSAATWQSSPLLHSSTHSALVVSVTLLGLTV